ncbi:MAG TPA: 30S ribosomal protein S11, partial [Elusimicrobiota bacterium]|nr:30S ribosomal protein S11 [Elusimicrobiota bacterium]
MADQPEAKKDAAKAAAKPAAKAPASAPKGKKKIWRDIVNARVYIQSSFNNTIVNITDERGNAIVWATAG